MTAQLPVHLPVATCIACGARNRPGECAGGCADVALDLVEAADVDAARGRLAALRERTARLRALARELDAGMPGGAGAAREAAREALRMAVPPTPEEPPAVVDAWGCPDCGRIDAPQPCLGVCIFRPVLMADAAELHPLTAEADALAEEDRALTALAVLVAHVRPRPGAEDRTAAALRERARALAAPQPH